MSLLLGEALLIANMIPLRAEKASVCYIIKIVRAKARSTSPGQL